MFMIRIGWLDVAAALVCALLFMPAGSSTAQSISEEESVRLALERNYELRAVRSEASRARAALDEARSMLLPSIDAQAGYRRLSDVPEVAVEVPGFDADIPLFPFERNQVHTEVSFEQPIFSGFRLHHTVRAARFGARSVEERLLQAEADVAFNVRTAFWRLHEAKAVVGVMESAVEAVDEYVREVGRRVEEGGALRSDLLAAQTRRSEVRLELIDAVNAADLAALELNHLLGNPLDTPLEPQGEPPLPTARLAENVLDSVKQSHPMIQALTSQMEVSRARLQATRGAWMPEIAAVGRLQYSRPNPYYYLEPDEFKGSWEVGVALRWSLFEGGGRAARVRGAAAEVGQLSAELDEAEGQIEVHLRRRLLEAKRTREAVEVSQNAVLEARESLRVARNLYEEGLVTTSQLLESEQAHRLAQVRLRRAEADRRVAEAAILNALGRVW